MGELDAPFSPSLDWLRNNFFGCAAISDNFRVAGDCCVPGFLCVLALAELEVESRVNFGAMATLLCLTMGVAWEATRS